MASSDETNLSVEMAVQLYQDTATSPALRDRAIEVVRAWLYEQTVRCINGLPLGHSLRERLLNDSEDIVQEVLLKTKDKYDANKGGFRAWARTVIRNELTDRLRELSRERITDEPPDTSSSSTSPQYAWFHEPFPPSDIRKLEEITPVRDRLVVVALAGLHRKVPQVIWDQWCQQAGVARPFPPPAADTEGWERGKAAIIAQAVGVPVNHVHQIWHRKASKLQELASLRDLRS